MAGCAHYPVNQPLDPAHASGRYDFKYFDNAENDDGAFVVLTFSGGGTRAAALAYGVLDKLRRTPLPGSNSRLLDKVNIISTVSGGSFTGAYYTLFGDRIFNDFRDRFLYRDVQTELGQDLLKIANLVRVMSPTYGRSELAEELYHESIFESKTFGAMAQKAKPPFLIINATNMVTGAPFEFTSSQFDYIGSDILSLPVARAVAASSAFPFLLSPISLKNYSKPAEFSISDDDREALQGYWKNKRRYYTVKNNLIYVNSKEHPFVHLIDGGVADNLGLRAVYNLFEKKALREKMEKNRIKRLLFIIVNARTDPSDTIEKDEGPPGLLTVGVKSFTIPMENYTFETVELLRSMLREKIKEQEAAASCQKLLDTYCKDGFRIAETAGGKMKLYIAELSFENLRDKKERIYFNDLPTSFSLEREQVDKLIEVGGRLLSDNPSFRKFLEEYSRD
jgi:NTE family protein